MKKVLFGTTAIVAAAFAGQALANGSVQHNDGVTLSVGGYFIAGVGIGPYSEQAAQHDPSESISDGDTYAGQLDEDLEKDFHIINDGEIHFKAKGTLDNGIGIEVRVELEAFYADGSQIDEHWMKVKTAFGTILVGANDTAIDKIAGGIGRMKGGIAGGSWDREYMFVPGATDYHLGDDGDGYSVQYYSPNISGFEFGVSYTPDTATPTTVNASSGTSTNQGNTTNSNDLITVGASYAGNFGDVDFAIGGGYATMEQDNLDEITTYGGGLELGFGAVTVGGAILMREEEFNTGGEINADYYGGGIEYETGPWVFGLSALFTEVDESNGAQNDDFEAFVLNAAVGYELGDGVNLGLGIDYGEVDFTGSSTDADDESIGGVLLLGVKF